jgi:hypothetical protein
MRSRNRLARAGGLTSAICLLITLIALAVVLIMFLVNPEVSVP